MGLLYGRGTQDDKGPLLASLFAVKALLDAGVKFNKRVRFIFGTDEETLWRCINRYKEKEETPTLGFSPDARFPLIYAEKGLLQLKLEGQNQTDLRFIWWLSLQCCSRYDVLRRGVAGGAWQQAG